MTTTPKFIMLDDWHQGPDYMSRNSRISWWKIVGMGKNSRYPSDILHEVVRIEREVLFLAPLALGGKQPGNLPRQLRLGRSSGRLSLLFLEIRRHALRPCDRAIDRSWRVDPDSSTDSILPVPITAVERLEIAHVGRVGGAEGIVVDRPARGVFGMAVAVLFDESM